MSANKQEELCTCRRPLTQTQRRRARRSWLYYRRRPCLWRTECSPVLPPHSSASPDRSCSYPGACIPGYDHTVQVLRSWPSRTLPRGPLTLKKIGLGVYSLLWPDINVCVLSYFEGTANLHCYRSCILTTLHCSKESFLQCCHMKIYNKIFRNMWGVYSRLWDTVCVYIYMYMCVW